MARAGGAGDRGRRYSASVSAPPLQRDAKARPREESARVWEAVRAGRLPLAATPAAADFAWAAAGAMSLTGENGEAPRLAPAPLALAAEQLLAGLRGVAWRAGGLDFDGAALLGERAACFGLAERRGRVAVGAECRLLRAVDGWLAVHLARDDDVGALPAWLSLAPPVTRDWARVAAALSGAGVEALVERARLLGLPVSPVAVAPTPAPPWCRVDTLASAAPRAEPPRVVDLSSLWAGPLATHLLERAGARVIKVESRARPDGARRGAPDFHALLNHGKASVALDFGDAADRRALRRLIDSADVVVESARPRALRQLGVDAERWVAEQPGRTWAAITGYGRRAPGCDWVAFGDDAGAAAGLCHATGDPDHPLFCGDAVADPIAGLHAALAVAASVRQGGGHLIDVSLVDGLAHWLGADVPTRVARVMCEAGRAFVEHASERVAVAAPRARAPRGAAPALGADTREILAAC